MYLRQDLFHLSPHRALTYFLFRKSPSFDESADRIKESENETIDFSRIRCPLCRWQPKSSSRWYCSDAGFPHYFSGGCGTVWNTFETRGRCPGCNYQWQWTDCLRCGGCSPHKAWYENEADRT